MKKKFNKNKGFSFFFICFGSFFIIFGTIFFVASHMYYMNLKENGIKTVGIISAISGSRDHINVLVTYKTNAGKEITTGLDQYDSSMYTGKAIEIYYDPLNPSKVILASGNFYLILLSSFGSFGLIFLVVGIVLNIKNRTLEKQRDKLILWGNYVMADIIEIKRNTSLKLNDENPYIVHSRYSENGIDYLFKSHNIWFKPSYAHNKTVRVYFDKNDFNNYYVDEDSLIKDL
ncbi:MAG: DUF3592 domain-containing protein [Treponema sp.]|jgi:hypothetical protein|nr:DUF3592 domain-containing protein [Treponema sp.]